MNQAELFQEYEDFKAWRQAKESATQVAEVETTAPCSTVQRRAKAGEGRGRKHWSVNTAKTLILLWFLDSWNPGKPYRLARLLKIVNTGVGELQAFGAIEYVGCRKYKITDKGRAFVNGTQQLPRYVTSGGGLPNVESDESVSIKDVVAFRTDESWILRLLEYGLDVATDSDGDSDCS